MKRLVLLLLLPLPLFALLITPEAALQQSFNGVTISKKGMLLGKSEAQKVQQLAQMKLSSKLFRLYKAEISGKPVGYGILLTGKIRSKTGAFLYIFTPEGILKTIEIVAFNEAMEWLPSKQWLSQFKNSTSDRFTISDNVIPISGATLSANAVVKNANLAKAIWMVKVQE